MMEPQDIHSMLNYMAPYRLQGTSFEVAHWGITSGEDAERDQALVASYAAVGVTWWLEIFMPRRWGGSWTDWPLEQMRHRIRRGPPKISTIRAV